MLAQGALLQRKSHESISKQLLELLELEKGLKIFCSSLPFHFVNSSFLQPYATHALQCPR